VQLCSPLKPYLRFSLRHPSDLTSVRRFPLSSPQYPSFPPNAALQRSVGLPSQRESSFWLIVDWRAPIQLDGSFSLMKESPPYSVGRLPSTPLSMLRTPASFPSSVVNIRLQPGFFRHTFARRVAMWSLSPQSHPPFPCWCILPLWLRSHPELSFTPPVPSPGIPRNQSRVFCANFLPCKLADSDTSPRPAVGGPLPPLWLQPACIQ